VEEFFISSGCVITDEVAQVAPIIKQLSRMSAPVAGVGVDNDSRLCAFTSGMVSTDSQQVAILSAVLVCNLHE
jgi:hypothetical protein